MFAGDIDESMVRHREFNRSSYDSELYDSSQLLSHEIMHQQVEDQLLHD